MKTLEVEFDANFDKSGVHHFKQVKREGNVAIYSRSRPDGHLIGYEVFKVKARPQERMPSGVLYEEREVYPNSEAFGTTARFCTTMRTAEARFKEFLTSDNELDN